MGFPELTPYQGGNATNNNAIIFAVAGSPMLDRRFFASRGIRLQPYASPLSTQMSWFKAYLETICSTPTGLYILISNFFVHYNSSMCNN